MKVTLVIDGEAEDVQSVVGLALEAGVLAYMKAEQTVDDLPVLEGKPLRKPGKPKESKTDIYRRFEIGATVEMKNSRQDRPDLPPPLTRGVVKDRRMSGRGVIVTVEWEGFDEQTKVPSSMLRVP